MGFVLVFHRSLEDAKWARMNDTKTKNSDGGKRIRPPWEGKKRKEKKKKEKERKEKREGLGYGEILELPMLEFFSFLFLSRFGIFAGNTDGPLRCK